MNWISIGSFVLALGFSGVFIHAVRRIAAALERIADAWESSKLEDRLRSQDS